MFPEELATDRQSTPIMSAVETFDRLIPQVLAKYGLSPAETQHIARSPAFTRLRWASVEKLASIGWHSNSANEVALAK